MDYNELKKENERLKVEIDTYHAFYESFNMYDIAISDGYGYLSEMYSELLKAKIKNPNNPAVINQEDRIIKLLNIFSGMTGLNNKCHSLSLRFKHINQELFNVKNELDAIKKAINEQ